MQMINFCSAMIKICFLRIMCVSIYGAWSVRINYLRDTGRGMRTSLYKNLKKTLSSSQSRSLLYHFSLGDWLDCGFFESGLIMRSDLRFQLRKSTKFLSISSPVSHRTNSFIRTITLSSLTDISVIFGCCKLRVITIQSVHLFQLFTKEIVLEQDTLETSNQKSKTRA